MSERPDHGEHLSFALLGPLRAWRNGIELDLGPRQQRLALSLLLLRDGGLVEFADFRHLIWDDAPPPTAVNMVHRYVGALRRLFEPNLTARSNGQWLIRETGGYRFVLHDADLDLSSSRRLIEEARRLVTAGDDDQAVDRYLSAMALWRGRCAAGLGPTAEAHPEFLAVDRECAEAARDAARAARRCGRGPQMLPALREVALRNPLDEALQAELLLVLSADGKQAESIALFGEMRRRLADDLGVDPGPELQAAYESVIRQGDTTQAQTVTGVRVPPAQLPADLRFFTGRGAQLREAAQLLLAGDESAPPVLSFDGMPGVGKSALAVRLAHRVTTHFPDGQLFADLHGFDALGREAEPADVLHGFLQALGVRREAIPPSLDARAALFRSLVSGRRYLLLLDNARDAEQVRPLLPGTPGNAVLVTSRRRLTGLAATHGAHLLHLGLPSRTEARDGFAARIGLHRAAAEPSAWDEIVQQCGRLPLALAVAAARAAAHPKQQLAALATDLRRTTRPLDALDDASADRDVRVVFSWSYQLLGEQAARLFRVLSLHPGPAISLYAAASLAGVPTATARSHLTELVRTGLIDWHEPAGGRMHDLLRLYARELSHCQDSAIEQAAARRRLLHHYLATAYAAVRVLRSSDEPVTTPMSVPGVTPLHFQDEKAVLEWSARERHALKAVIWQAVEEGDTGAASQLAVSIRDLFHRQGWQEDWAGLFSAVRGPASGEEGRYGGERSPSQLGTSAG